MKEETTKKIPKFLRKEVVIKEPDTQDAWLLSEVETTVMYVGENQEYYKQGDTVLVLDPKTVFSGRKIKHFGEPVLYVLDENRIICRIDKE